MVKGALSIGILKNLKFNMSNEDILQIIQSDSFLTFEFNRLKNNWLNKDRLLKILYKKWIKNESLAQPTRFEP